MNDSKTFGDKTFGDKTRPVRLAVLGSTGSIGRQALEVAAAWPGRVQVVALAAGRNASLLGQQAAAFGARHLALSFGEPTPGGPASGCSALSGSSPGGPNTTSKIAIGQEAVTALAALDDVDCVLNAMVGSIGLRASYVALASGKRLLLANKESLVVGGDLLMPLAGPGQLIPVDSEHSAIFQCLQGEPENALARIWLTASGGPFRGWRRERLAGVDAARALAHPTWRMGPKITIDSATLMNKGLEVIEAMHLFGLPPDRIEVLVHAQSVIHSMVEFADGSVKAQLGPADMRIPIQYAMSYPDRWPALLEPLDFRQLGAISFAAPDRETFGCLSLALAAAEAGGTVPAAMNAANEVAVAAFLEGSCGFLDIEACVENVLAGHQTEAVESIDQLEAVDAEARRKAREFLGQLPSSRPAVRTELLDRNGLTEAEFLAAYDASRYERPSVTVDVALFVRSSDDAAASATAPYRLLLIKRGGHPFLGKWALPGGFVNPDETLEQAAARELAEETNIQSGQVDLRQVHAFSDPRRDPRTRIITCLFVAIVDETGLLDAGAPSYQAGDDAADARLFTLDEVFDLELAGDHRQIIEYAVAECLKS